MTPEFWLTTFVVVATPGTGAIYSLSTGLTRGRGAAVVAALGCTLGTVPHVVAAITGVAALLHASAVAFGVLKWIGVGYLLYLAWVTARDHSDLAAQARTDPGDVPAWRTVREAVLINLLNPKLTIFFFAFLPQFVTPGRGATSHMLVLSALFMLVTFVVFAGYGVAAAAVRQHVIERPRVVQNLRRFFAGSYVALAGRLALEGR